MRIFNGLVLASMIAMMPMTAMAKDICLKDNYEAKWRLKFAQSVKKPGQFASVSGFRLESKVVPVYGTVLVNGEGKIKLGLYVNRSEDFNGFPDFTITAIGSSTFFTKTSTETAPGQLIDSGTATTQPFSFEQLIDCKTVIPSNIQP